MSFCAEICTEYKIYHNNYIRNIYDRIIRFNIKTEYFSRAGPVAFSCFLVWTADLQRPRAALPEATPEVNVGSGVPRSSGCPQEK